MLKIEIPEIQGLNKEDKEVTYALVNSLVHRYLHNSGSTSLLYWLDKFSSQREGTIVTMALAKDGIIVTSVAKKNYAEVMINEDYLLQQYSKEELIELQRKTLLNKYKPVEEAPTSIIAGSCHVKLPNGVQVTGLSRFGFAKCSQHKFKYDINMLIDNYDRVTRSVTKSMKKMEEQLGYSLVNEEGLDYESISKLVVDYVIDSDKEYSLGKLTLDSRGRAIYKCLKKVFNPISNKYARSLVVTPGYRVDDKALNNIFLYIAELVSGFDGDIQHKLENGKRYYQEKRLPERDDNDYFEVIWLQRLYKELDEYYANNKHMFTTPIELDFSASNMVIIGLLLGHSDYIDHTKYMWKVPGLTKKHVKFAQTPYVFGSSASVSELWRKNGVDYTPEQLLIMRREQLKVGLQLLIC